MSPPPSSTMSPRPGSATTSPFTTTRSPMPGISGAFRPSERRSQQNGPRGGTYVTEALRGAIQKYRTRRGHVHHRHHRRRVCRQNPGAAARSEGTAAPGHAGKPLRLPAPLRRRGRGRGPRLPAPDRGGGRRAGRSAGHAAPPRPPQPQPRQHFRRDGPGVSRRRHRRAVRRPGAAGRAGPVRSDHVPDHRTPPNPATRRTWDGGVGTLGFLPRRVLLGCEYAPAHPRACRSPSSSRRHGPASASDRRSRPAAPPGRDHAPPTLAPSRKPGFHLPWVHHSPEEDAARAEADRQRAELAQRV